MVAVVERFVERVERLGAVEGDDPNSAVVVDLQQGIAFPGGIGHSAEAIPPGAADQASWPQPDQGPIPPTRSGVILVT